MAKKVSSKKVKQKEIEGVYAKTQNVVVSANIHRDLPLEKLATKLERAEYNPEQFPGLILKMEETATQPKASALLFSSGKIICTGTKSMREARKAVEAIVRKLEAIGLKVTGKPDMEVQNMVASGSVGGKLNLNEIVFKFENTEYEPEQFPGLVYKLPDSHITFLLFGTGKIVVTGAKSEKEIIESVYILRDQLRKGGELKT
jgi:transcription initiation factor TFIID TATA-box-binding protein